MSFPMAARPGGLQGYSEAGNGPDFAGGNVPQQSGAQVRPSSLGFVSKDLAADRPRILGWSVVEGRSWF